MEVVRIDYPMLRFVQGSDPWDLLNLHDQIDLNGGLEEYFRRIHLELRHVIHQAYERAHSHKIPLTSISVKAPHRLGVDEDIWKGYAVPRHPWHHAQYSLKLLRDWFALWQHGQTFTRVGNRHEFTRRFLSISFHATNVPCQLHPTVSLGVVSTT